MTLRNGSGRRGRLAPPVAVLGALVGAAALVGALVVAFGRGYRTDTTTLLLAVTAVLGVVLVVAAVALGRPPAALRTGALTLAVLGLLAAAATVATIDHRPRMGSVVFDAVDQQAALVLRTPAGVRSGDVLVAQVLHGPGDLRAPDGWTLLRSTPLAAGAVSVFVREVDDAEPPSVAFTSDAPGGKVGGVAAFSEVDGVDGVEVVATSAGTGGPLTAPAAEPDSSQAPLVYLAGTAGATRVTPSPATVEIWQARVDGVFKATVEASVRPPGSEDPGPVALNAAPEAAGGWVVDVLELTPA